MRGFFLIVKAELVRSFIIMRRYWFAAILGLAMGYGMLIMIVFGLMSAGDAAKAIAGVYIDKILGFLIGVFAFGIVGLFTQGLQGMARTGELEQVCLSPYGLVTNFLARSFVAALNSIASSAVMLLLVAYTVSENVHLAPIETVVLLGLTYVNLIGFGFMVGGLVLIFKQVGQVALIVRLVMLGLAIFAEKVQQMPALIRWIAHALPITDAAICLKYTLVQGQQRFVFDETGQQLLETVHSPVFFHQSFLFLLVSCAVWTTIGIVCFKFMENWSRDKGTLGAY